MSAMSKSEIAEQRRKYNKWLEGIGSHKKPKKQESSEDFINRGGVVNHCPPVKIDFVGKSKQCCTGTFKNLI